MPKKYKTHTLAPFCSSSLSVNQTLLVFLITIIPYVVFLFITQNVLSLQLLLIILLTSICAEFVYCIIKSKTVSVSFSTLLQALLIGLLVPEQYSFFLAAVIPFFVLLAERMIFGSFSQSWINPVVLTVIIMFFSSPDSFPDFLLSPESIQYQNIATKLVSDGLIQVNKIDIRLTTFLNSTIFNNLGISVPEGYFTLLGDSQSVIPAFRFNILTIIASIILIITKSIDYILPIVFLIVYSIFVYTFSLFPYASIYGNGDILLALFTSGTLFAAFFIFGWFGTTPLTVPGKVLCGIFAGFFAFLICGPGTSTIGIFFVALMLNIVAPVILHVESKIYSKMLRKKIELMQALRK